MAGISPFLLFGGAGIALLGIGSIAYWKMKKKTASRLFLLGGGFWLLATVAKMALDLLVTGSLWHYSGAAAGSAFFLLFLSLYFGLRTGVLDCAIPYLYGKKKFLDASFEDAVGFGLGFGGAGALASGISLLLLGFGAALPGPFSVSPSATVLPPLYIAAMAGSGAHDGLLFAVAAVTERALALVVISLSAVLVFAAVQGKRAFLLESFVFRGVLDAGVFLAGGIALSSGGNMLASEVPVAVVGLVSASLLLKARAMGIVGTHTHA